MPKNFTPVTAGAFEFAMLSISASEVQIPGTLEKVYETPAIVGIKSGKEFPYKVRVYSGIDVRTNASRKTGADAIRVTVVSTLTNKQVHSVTRVNRVSAAHDENEILERVVERCRDAYRWVFGKQVCCPKCGSFMVERKAKKTGKKFFGCSGWPVCSGVFMSEVEYDNKLNDRVVVPAESNQIKELMDIATPTEDVGAPDLSEIPY